MNGASIIKTASFSVPAELEGYTLAATADYNGDGLADLVWTNGSNVVPWLNQGQCSGAANCAFSTIATLQVPSGQAIFNSSIPMTTAVMP
jgi:hypothetical protein